jgi:hypothetical protein
MKIVEVSLRDTLTIFARGEQGVRVRCQPALHFNLSYIQVGQRAFAFQLLLNGLQEYFVFFNCKEEIFLPF